MKLFKPSYAVFIVVLAAVLIDIDFKNWEKRDRVIEHDVHSYYSYLPLAFIYDDLKVKKDDYRFGDNYYFFWQHPDEDGHKVAKMTCGLSMMYAPFFFVAHFVAQITPYPSNGFSEPYKIFLLLSSIFYLIIGLDFLIKILRLYLFSEKHITIALLLLGLGTNLLAYTTQSAAYSHTYSFCLFAGFIYNTIKWYESPKLKRIVWLGLLFGLITLIRPSNGIIVLFFILYGIKHFSDIKINLLLFKKHFFQLLIVLPLVLLIWYPQLRYWKIVSGEWIYYSYRQEGFYFLDPKIMEGLFSFRKGWLVYTPLMGFAIAGLFLLKQKARNIKWASIVFILLNIYVVFSWWCWWYGGTFGQRVMIESYALLVIPLASFIQWIDNRQVVLKFSFYGLAVFFVWLNIFQTYQFENHSLHHDSMSSELYFKQFGKMEKVDGFDNYLDWIDYSKNKHRGENIKETIAIQKKINTEAKTINIKSPNGMYWCTEWDGFLISDKSIADEWENYSLESKADGSVKILSYDGKYLSSENGFLVAKSTDAEQAADFILDYKNDSTLKIINNDSLFVAMDTVSKKLVFDKNRADEFIILHK